MARKPYTDPNPQLGRPGIARRFTATEERKPPGAGATPVDQGATADARRAAPLTGKHPVGAAPTVDEIRSVTADVNAFADKLAADKAARKRAKGHGKVVLPRAPIIKASDLKPPKKAKAKKRGRPATSKQPWLDAGVSRATYFRRQGKSG